jgi:LPS O-antigen subunit length determinant protein (WzzB/FepE family)
VLKTPVYRAGITVIPVAGDEAAGALSRLAGQFGGLAGLAGVNLGGSGNSQEAMALLRSQAFGESLIVDEDLMPLLFAGRWDAESGKWRADRDGDVPTLWDGWLRFDRKVRTILEDRDRGLVTIRIEMADRERAAALAASIVERANRQLRERKLAEIDGNLDYLRTELARAELVELRQAISRVMEAQVSERMLASARSEYAFRVLDPPRVPDADRPVRPRRALLAALGTVAGALLGFLLGTLLSYGAAQRGQP